MGFKEALQQARPVLLEPIMHLEIAVPDESMGDVIGDLNSRRARCLGAVWASTRAAEPGDPRTQAPMAEVLKYAPDLPRDDERPRRLPHELSHYEECPTSRRARHQGCPRVRGVVAHHE